CVRLYEKADFEALRKSDGTTRFEGYENDACLSDRAEEEEGKAGARTPMSQDQTGKQSLATKEYQKRQSIELRIAEVRDASVRLQVTVYDDFFNRNNAYVGSETVRHFPVDVSYFDLPYMDNIKLADGNRFSIVLKRIFKDPGENEMAQANMEAVRFKNDFMSLQDRPLFEEMLKKLQQSPTTR
ncbi:MAG: hypothetical protein ACXWME_09400, partial [Syntrophales bacterium]